MSNENIFCCVFFFFFKQKTAYEIGWCDWSSNVCSSDLQAEADQHAGHFEGVIHLGDEGNRAAFADEHGLLAEAFFQCGLRLLENRIVIRSSPRFSRAQEFKFAVNRFGQPLSNVLLDELRDLLWILIRDEARGEFCKRL